jgi:hypothetical protein
VLLYCKKVRLLLPAVCVCALTGALPVEAAIYGDQYFIQGANFPGAYGPSPVTFDGVEELIPGSGTMMVNELSVAWPGGGPGPYAAPGELLKFSFRTSNGAQLAGNPFALVNLFLTDLDWNIPGKTQVVREDSAYLYFTANGTPLPMVDAMGLGLIFAVDPLSGAQVVLLGNSPIAGTVDGLNLPDPFPDDAGGNPLTWFLTMNALGITGAVNDVHMGILVDTVPEPCTLLLLVGGLAALIRRRRR